ncbi:alpha/beta fold hydrolase [Veronia nyctiphanis]|nr:alpha/beta fold hydrolase [Veronia nyctiphanis]
MEVQKVTLPDGHHTEVHWSHPPVQPQGVVILVSALGVSVDYYRGLVKQWSERGYIIARFESRGMRYSSVNDVINDNFGYREVLDVDMATIIPFITQQYPDLPVWLCGHSLGGQFALMYASDYLPNLEGVMLLAAGSNHFRTLKSSIAVTRRQLEIKAIRVVNQCMGYFPGHRVGFGGKQPKNLMADWSYEGLTGRYKVVNSDKDYNVLLKELALPVMMISFAGDHWVPKRSADRLAEKLIHCSVVQKELSYSWKSKPVDHFTWSKAPEQVLDAFEEWVASEKRKVA